MNGPPTAWITVAEVPPADLRESSLELHWAAQYVAAAGQTFVDARADDSHRSMTWDFELGALVGEEFSGGYGFRVALRPDDLTLRLLDRTRTVLGVQPLSGVTLEDGYDRLADAFRTYMGHSPDIARPEYDLPPHALADGAPFALGRQNERAALQALYGSAADLLGKSAAGRDGASAVRCWPHHFDIATLLTVVEGAAGGSTPEDSIDSDASTPRTVGIGMAPYGGGYEDWYWYVNPYPYPSHDQLPTLTPPAHWHTDGWVGAVLRGAQVAATPASEREALVSSFVTEAVAVSIKALVS